MPLRPYRLMRFRRRRPIDAMGDAALAQEGEGYQPVPEDFLPSPPKPLSPLARMPDRAKMRPAVALYTVFWAISLHDWRTDRGAGLWASGQAVLHEHEYWRLFTALGAHADMGHLLSNTPLFLIFGWFLHAFFGWWVFPGAVLLIGAASNLLTVYAYDPHSELLGASGMLYGMVALWLVLYVRFETAYPWGARLLRAVGVSLLLLFPTSFVPETSYMAHVTGFILGLAGGALAAPWVQIQIPATASAEVVTSAPHEPMH